MAEPQPAVKQESPFFRSMTDDDLPLVLAVEQQAYSHPWRAKTFSDCLRAGYICQLAVEKSEVVGYFVVMMAADEAELLNLCVHPEHQQGGYGLQLLNRATALACRAGATQMFLEVRQSNQRAIALYERYGFVEHGVRPGYYPLTERKREDALMMAMHF